MRLLLDAHTLIWAVDNPVKLGEHAVNLLQDSTNQLFLGAGTIWEIAIKVGLGKLSLSVPYREWMNQAIADLQLAVLPITVAYASVQAELPNLHDDPFDRLLVAQAQVEQIEIVSADTTLDSYGINRLW